MARSRAPGASGGSALPAVDVRVVGIAGHHVDYPRLIADQLRAHGLRCEHYSIPFLPLGALRPSILAKLRTEFRKTPAAAVLVYCSGSAEYYLRGPDVSVHFSAFRSWFDADRMCVIAHPWTNAEPLPSQTIAWTEKPAFKVGFLGTTYRNSAPGRLVSTMPASARNWLLKGHWLRSADLIATAYAARIPLRYSMAFPRAETIAAAKAHCAAAGAQLRIVDTGGFTGHDEQVQAYARHMADTTYVLCPRGAENFSYRLYETLKFGRVPVLIDTDMVLPGGMDWDELVVRVPYSRLSKIGEIVAQDYRNRSAAEFILRQRRALEAMEQLQAGGWADGLVADVRRRLAAKSSPIQAKVLDSAMTV